MAKTSSKRKASQKVTSRAWDTPDPSCRLLGRLRPTLSDVLGGSEPEDEEAAAIASQKETSDYEPVAAPSEDSNSDDEASNVSIDSEPVKAKVAAKPASKPSIKKALKGPQYTFPHTLQGFRWARIQTMGLAFITQALYSIIGCTDIHKSNLPVLSCQFSKDPLKVKYKLSEDNWDFIKKEYQTEVQKKRDDAKINISLPPQFLDNLLASKKVHKAKNATISTKRGKVMGSKNLYLANDEYINEEDQFNMDAHYFPSYQMLEARVCKELSKFQLHKGELCKINKHNKHQRISNVLLREWVEASKNGVDPRDSQIKSVSF
ncbi:hypothetical protein JB92DRAFT_3299936 [Gautieria morchelliformis]|nr:hypothetical protein JB92DRAFT_3299936 [Gautieria morchelliformis]